MDVIKKIKQLYISYVLNTVTGALHYDIEHRLKQGSVYIEIEKMLKNPPKDDDVMKHKIESLVFFIKINNIPINIISWEDFKKIELRKIKIDNIE